MENAQGVFKRLDTRSQSSITPGAKFDYSSFRPGQNKQNRSVFSNYGSNNALVNKGADLMARYISISYPF